MVNALGNRTNCIVVLSQSYPLPRPCIRPFAQHWEKGLGMKAITHQYATQRSKTFALKVVGVVVLWEL